MDIRFSPLIQNEINCAETPDGIEIFKRLLLFLPSFIHVTVKTMVLFS